MLQIVQAHAVTSGAGSRPADLRLGVGGVLRVLVVDFVVPIVDRRPRRMM
jgi:hypothetical protein